MQVTLASQMPWRRGKKGPCEVPHSGGSNLEHQKDTGNLNLRMKVSNFFLWPVLYPPMKKKTFFMFPCVLRLGRIIKSLGTTQINLSLTPSPIVH